MFTWYGNQKYHFRDNFFSKYKSKLKNWNKNKIVLVTVLSITYITINYKLT